MADGKYLELTTTGTGEAQAIESSAGAGDASKIPRTDSTGKISLTFMPTGIGPDLKELTASEDLTAGDFVNIWDDTGVWKARKADAAGGRGKQVHGFILSGVTSGAAVSVFFEGINDQLTGLAAGEYFLSATAGQASQSVPTTSGYIYQSVGMSISATEISFERSEPIPRV
jgi:hypothetical protein